MSGIKKTCSPRFSRTRSTSGVIGTLAPSSERPARAHRLARDDLGNCLTLVHLVGVYEPSRICSLVPMSGAVTSVCGPTNGIISFIYGGESA